MSVNQEGSPASATPLESVPPGAPLLEDVVKRVQEISTLPTVALRVMEVAGDPESGAADLKNVIEADPTLCVRVLRCVNSAAYGLRENVDDLNQAVSYLGFNQIRDLAVTASVSDLFKKKRDVGSYRRLDLWKHMVAVGVCARMIAVRSKIQSFANAFLSGLLHDVGLILFDQSCHEEFRRVINTLSSSRTLVETEQGVVGWDHTVLGYELGKKWKLPPTVLHGIRYHHEPNACPPVDRVVVQTVALANLVCSVKHITSVGKNLVGLCDSTLDTLKLTKTDLKVIAEDLDAEIELNKHLFEIQRG